jgi:hypothetical protein
MTVAELIAALRKEPQDLEVRVWDHEADEYVPVVQALYEDGSTSVDLLTHHEETVPANECGVCGRTLATCDCMGPGGR